MPSLTDRINQELQQIRRRIDAEQNPEKKAKMIYEFLAMRDALVGDEPQK